MAFEESREKLGIIGELWMFMRVRKKWWLGPIVVMLALLGLLVVFTQGSAVAPFIYTLVLEPVRAESASPGIGRPARSAAISARCESSCSRIMRGTSRRVMGPTPS